MRKGMAQGLARPVYYDRNPIVKSFYANQSGAAPHAQSAARWTYTVPAGRRAFIEAIEDLVYRNSVATTVGFINVTVSYTPSGGSAAAADIVTIGTNVVGDRDRQTQTSFGYMNAGDNLQTSDADLSVGGNATEVSAAKIIEFDA